MTDDRILFDYQERAVRLTKERWQHILGHPEMIDQQTRLIETVAWPDVVIATIKDKTVHAYHRLYEETPVTRKYLVVVVKIESADAFVLTAYFSSRLKKGQMVWHP